MLTGIAALFSFSCQQLSLPDLRAVLRGPSNLKVIPEGLQNDE
jgi:hypothetical protein